MKGAHREVPAVDLKTLSLSFCWLLSPVSGGNCENDCREHDDSELGFGFGSIWTRAKRITGSNNWAEFVFCRLKVRKHTHWERLSNVFLTYPNFEPVDSLTVAHSTPLLEERRTRKNLYNQAREVILTFRSQFSQFGLSAWEPNALSQNLSSHALIV